MINNTLREYKEYCYQSTLKGQYTSWKKSLDLLTSWNTDKHYIKLCKLWYSLIFEQSFLDELPDDTEELLFHSSESCTIKRKDRKEVFLHDIEACDYSLMLKTIALKNNIEWSLKSPFVSFFYTRRSKRFRLSFLHESLSPDKEPKSFFRTLKTEVININQYTQKQLLKEAILNKKNILVAGATGSGKTTLVNSLLSITSADEHILILEDTYELISPHRNTTRLLSTKNESGSLDSLLTYGLRMSPDRIVLGELRSREVTTFIQAMNTGHRGMISTIHANSAKDALLRAALLFNLHQSNSLDFHSTLKFFCENIDHVVYIENKLIKEFIDVFGSEKSQVFFDLKN